MNKNDEFIFDESKIQHEFLEVSKFSVLFQKKCINYLQSVESYIKKACELKKIKFSIDYNECIMEVSTTKDTRDPYVIIKANDFIQLLSKSVLLENAIKIFQDNVFCEIVPLKLISPNDKTMENRKRRLGNPKTLKAIELLTKCHVLISGKFVCIIGNYKGLNEAKSIVVNCFENIHPVFEIKKLMVKKNLEKDKINDDWKRYLPNIQKTHSKKHFKSRETGGMPEDIKDRKEDIMMATGEYYFDKDNIEKLKMKEEKRKKREQIRQSKKQKFEEPDE